MKRIFVDTHALYLRQNGEGGERGQRPILIQDVRTNKFSRASEVILPAGAKVVFNMRPGHNLARVWIEADEVESDAIPTEWSVHGTR